MVNKTKTKKVYKGSFVILLMLATLISYFLFEYLLHCTWAATSYDCPDFVFSSYDNEGNKETTDDFREAYYWLRMNTPENSNILAWWDYGYQITGMSKRGVIVDNNTWNNTHIGSVGAVF